MNSHRFGETKIVHGVNEKVIEVQKCVYCGAIKASNNQMFNMWCPVTSERNRKYVEEAFK